MLEAFRLGVRCQRINLPCSRQERQAGGFLIGWFLCLNGCDIETNTLFGGVSLPSCFCFFGTTLLTYVLGTQHTPGSSVPTKDNPEMCKGTKSRLKTSPKGPKGHGEITGSISVDP